MQAFRGICQCVANAPLQQVARITSDYDHYDYNEADYDADAYDCADAHGDTGTMRQFAMLMSELLTRLLLLMTWEMN